MLKTSKIGKHLNTLALCALSALFLSSCANQTSVTDNGSSSAINTSEVEHASIAKQAWAQASQGSYSEAKSTLSQLDRTQTLSPEETADLSTLQDSVYFAWANAIILDAQASSAPHTTDKATKDAKSLTWLKIPSIQANIDTLPEKDQIGFWNFKAEQLSKNLHIEEAVKARVFIEHITINNGNHGDALFIENQTKLWALLSLLDAQEIQSIESKNLSNNSLQAWLTLTKITLHSNLSLNQQITAIDHWQLNNSTHPGSLIPPQDISLIRNALRARPTHIGVILPMHGKYKVVGEAIRDGILKNYYQSDYKPYLSFYSTSETDDFLSTYQAAVDDGADWIIGPLLKDQVEALYTLESLPVTTLALNKLQLDKVPPKGLIEYSLSPFDEIDSLIPLMESQQANRIITLAQKKHWAEEASLYFNNQWQAFGHEPLGTFFFENSRAQSVAVQQALHIDISKKRIQKMKWLLGGNIETHERRRQDVDSIFILSKPQQAASLRPLLAFHYASNLNMYATSNIYRGYSIKSIDNDLRGIQFTDTPITIQSAQETIDYYGKSPFIRMYGLGLDVFSITERFSLLSQLNNSHFYGATGIIGVNQNTLSRKTDYAYFKSGKVLPLVINESDDEKQ